MDTGYPALISEPKVGPPEPKQSQATPDPVTENSSSHLPPEDSLKTAPPEINT